MFVRPYGLVQEVLIYNTASAAYFFAVAASASPSDSLADNALSALCMPRVVKSFA